MTFLCSGRGLALLGLLLTACVTSAPVEREDVEAPKAVSSSWEDARADPTCVVPLCDEERCAIWRCQDVTEGDDHPVLLAQVLVPQTEPMLPLPLGPGPNASRWWGHPLAEPRYASPVFEIPWHNWKTRELSKRRLYLSQCLIPREPFEKHHIFPQEPGLARWFKREGLDIHAFTIRIPQSFHRWLHSGGPNGGQWN
ncbi:TIGR02269 family lipoprotein [Archangium sp. miwbw1]|uniref:TIGR02269 family lipoprotein n=1 Tax=Archangium lansingense TaxID=2995310 RepID=A0ABT4A268_9BACT|nr:TIGR02269 family lipoprotein [Archangium lansinium]MCY1075441.1 TIGR02269 family lipoprotein [Archangium lansinium]